MDSKELFLKKFQSIFDETSPDQIQLNTIFKDLEEWSSLTILSLIVLCEEEYNIKLPPIGINDAQKVEDLFMLLDRQGKNQYK